MGIWTATREVQPRKALSATAETEEGKNICAVPAQVPRQLEQTGKGRPHEGKRERGFISTGEPAKAVGSNTTLAAFLNFTQVRLAQLPNALDLIVRTEEGIVTVVNAVSPEKADSPISAIEVGREIVVNAVFPENATPSIAVSEVGMVMVFNELSPEKVPKSMKVTEVGMVMVVNAVAPSKAKKSISMSEVGREMVVNAVSPLKAEPPILVTEMGMEKVFNAGLKAKA